MVEAAPDLLQQRVTALAPEGVVDCLETVEVHDENDELTVGLSRLGDGLGEGVAEIDLVGEPCQRIMQGLVADLALEELAAGF